MTQAGGCLPTFSGFEIAQDQGLRPGDWSYRAFIAEDPGIYPNRLLLAAAYLGTT